MKKEDIKGKIRILIGFLISGGFLFLCLKEISDFKSFSELKNVSAGFFFFALLAIVGEYIFQTIRWDALLKPIKKIGFTRLFSSVMLGHFYNIILPTRLGEIIRPLHLSKKENLQFTILLGSCVLERIYDGLLMVFTFLLGLVLLDLNDPVLNLAAPIGLGIFGFALLCVIIALRTKLLMRIIAILPFPKIKDFLQEKTEEFIKGLNLLSSWKHFLLVLSWSAFPVLLNVISGLLILYSMDLPEVLTTFPSALLITGALGLAYTIPSAPSGVGVINMAVYLAMLGICKNEGLEITESLKDKLMVVSFVFYIASIIPGLLLGLIAFVKERKTIK